MAHQRTGAAPPPEAVALPATTPRPGGGPGGESGDRSSMSRPVGAGSEDRAAAACVAALGAECATSGIVGVGATCATGDPGSGPDKRVATPDSCFGGCPKGSSPVARTERDEAVARTTAG